MQKMRGEINILTFSPAVSIKVTVIHHCAETDGEGGEG